MNITLIVVSAVVLINLVVSVAVLRALALTPTQRLLQLLLIWFAPLVGAAICAAFVSSQALGPESRTAVDPPYPEGDGGPLPDPSTNGWGCASGDGAGCSGGEGGGD